VFVCQQSQKAQLRNPAEHKSFISKIGEPEPCGVMKNVLFRRESDPDVDIR
jgi:hypothetical protein